jgi:transposase
VLCVDEKPVALHGEVREPIALKAGSVRKRDAEYTRHGTANVFCAVEPKKGKYINTVTKRRTGNDFAKFLGALSRGYSEVEKIVLIMDNLNTHGKKSLTRFYGEERGGELWERFEVHYTPKHGSWLNQAEIAIGMYSRQCLGSSRTDTVELLKKKTKAWNRIANQKNITINWKFTKRDAREKFDYR